MKVELKVIQGPHEGVHFEFDQHETFIFGRSPSTQFRFSNDDIFFSRHHFLIELNPPLCRLIDLKSRNGTFVNGKRVRQIDLKDGDEIRGGHTHLRVSVKEQSEEKISLIEEKVPVRLKKSPNQSSESLDAASSSQSIVHESLEIPDHQLIREIGRGGMGTVYLAKSEINGELVAAKVVRPAVIVSQVEIDRFIREAEVMKALDHPHIVRFREFHEKKGQIFILMDYVQGQTADELLKSRTHPMPVKEALQLILQLVDALAFAHIKGFVHRDIKPANLLIQKFASGEQRLKLADFGLAKTYQSSSLSGLTMTGEIGGTTPYMPPEQVTDYKNVAPTADQYSTAATLYNLLTGHPIYDFPREVARQLLTILQEPPIPVEKRRSDLPQGLTKVIHKALSRDPSKRYSDISEFGRELREYL